MLANIGNHPQKTKCMLFSTNQGNIKPQILFNNEDVEFVVNHKHLDVSVGWLYYFGFK
jgi:hypothetical protein